MYRQVSAALDVQVHAASLLAVQVAVANPEAHRADETIRVTLKGKDVAPTHLAAPHGGRIWVVDAQPGPLRIEYEASLEGIASPPNVDLADRLIYSRPSRYCESDRLTGFAARLFHGIVEPHDILAAVSSWVGTQLEYVSGSSGPTDGAVDTLLAGKGVCRDFAHLSVALLRALGIPARLVAVFAPGLKPMDFHAIAEAFIDDGWYVVDGTLLAPRHSLVRIATGRDAADTSFLSNLGGQITLENMTVTATVDGDLPGEDVTSLVQLA